MQARRPGSDVTHSVCDVLPAKSQSDTNVQPTILNLTQQESCFTVVAIRVLVAIFSEPVR